MRALRACAVVVGVVAGSTSVGFCATAPSGSGKQSSMAPKAITTGAVDSSSPGNPPKLGQAVDRYVVDINGAKTFILSGTDHLANDGVHAQVTTTLDPTKVDIRYVEIPGQADAVVTIYPGNPPISHSLLWTVWDDSGNTLQMPIDVDIVTYGGTKLDPSLGPVLDFDIKYGQQISFTLTAYRGSDPLTRMDLIGLPDSCGITSQTKTNDRIDTEVTCAPIPPPYGHDYGLYFVLVEATQSDGRKVQSQMRLFIGP